MASQAHFKAPSRTPSWIHYFESTIGKKKLMGLTGLGYSGFVLTHMLGNLLLFVGPEAYNKYSYKLTSTPLIFVAEAALILMLLLHVVLAVQLTARNRAARPIGYAGVAMGEKKTSGVAKTLILSGLLLLVFIVLHLATFKFGPYYSIVYDGQEMRDIHRLVMEKFQSPLYVGWYLLCLAVLGAHLSHGVKSSFQSLGLFAANHPTLKALGLGFALVVSLGFISQPLYALFFYHGGQ
jgi:succinate dehydrogenase / fumarate reductase cytochrome b subunit